MSAAKRGARTKLADFGIFQAWSARYGSRLFVLLAVVTCIAGFWAAENHFLGKDTKGTDALTALLALGAFLIGFQQWRSAKQEASLERFYDRLKLANDARSVLSETDQKIAPMDLYVFAELDNLEYVLEKYRLGYMAPKHALRGVNTFRSRLDGVPGFDNTLRKFGNLAEGAGYQQETATLVTRLLSARAVKLVALQTHPRN